MQTNTSAIGTAMQPADIVARGAGAGRVRRLAAKPRLRHVLVALVATVTVGGASLASQATAQPTPLKVSGTFVSKPVTGPSCTAPTGQCFAGAFYGQIEGKTSGAVLSVTPTQQPGVSLFDASFTIHTRNGDLTFAHEQILYNTSPSGKGELSILAEITGGTDSYAGATGYVQGVGTSPPSTGATTGRYFGEITLG
jgi:hypothetical protein